MIICCVSSILAPKNEAGQASVPTRLSFRYGFVEFMARSHQICSIRACMGEPKYELVKPIIYLHFAKQKCHMFFLQHRVG